MLFIFLWFFKFCLIVSYRQLTRSTLLMENGWAMGEAISKGTPDNSQRYKRNKTELCGVKTTILENKKNVQYRI